jgi:hypothetical protein
MTVNREKVARIIQALLSKTTENGATEAEAMAAAEKARDLMDRYQIEAGNAGLEEEGAFKVTVKRGHYKTLVLKDRLARAVAEFCDCKVWVMKRQDELHYFGLRSDADFAAWLTATLDQFMINSVQKFILSQPRMEARLRWEAEKAFVFGACNRINERLVQLTKERRASRQTSGDGRSLVVVKNAIVQREFAKLGMKLRSASGSRAMVKDNGAYGAGRAAGDRASFGRPVNGPGGSVAMIGRR